MAEWSQIGKLLLIVGSALVFGARLLKEGRLPWLGRLPGDIRIERKGFSCYVPLATSILVSLFLSLVLNIVVRLLKR